MRRSRWHRPQIDLFATRFNKLPLFVSPVPDALASAMDALSLPWEDLDAAILGKVVEKSPDSRVAKNALVLGSSGHVQPNPTEPAQSALPVDTALQSDPHRYLTNLNSHAWLLDPQQSRSRTSVRQ